MDWSVILTIVTSAIGGLWTGWLTLRTRRIDTDQKAADSSLALERVKIEKEFDRQKDFQDDLIGECKALREECRGLRDQLSKANEQVIQQAAIIRERDDEIGKLKGDMAKMQTELDTVKRHVQELERRAA